MPLSHVAGEIRACFADRLGDHRDSDHIPVAGRVVRDGVLLVVATASLVQRIIGRYHRKEFLMSAVILESALTCPVCSHTKTEIMPTDACQWFYECEQCHTVLKPMPGDCCVYCSYGTVPCPPIQEHGKNSGNCCGS